MNALTLKSTQRGPSRNIEVLVMQNPACVFSCRLTDGFPGLGYGDGVKTAFRELALLALILTVNLHPGIAWAQNGGYTNWDDLVTNWVQAVVTDSAQTIVSNGNWDSVAASADGTRCVAVFDAARAGGIYLSTNSGATWVRSSTTNEYDAWDSVASSADGTKLLVADSPPGGIWTSIDSGATWIETGAPAGPSSWNCVASSADGTRLAAAASYGGIYTSTDSGVTWTRTSAAVDVDWYRLASSADGARLVALGGSNIWTTADSGVSWTQTSAPGRYWSSVASSADGTRLAAAASVWTGAIYTSTDAGATWTLTSAPLSNDWRCVVSSADGTTLVAASYGSGIWISTDSGVTWTKTSAPAPPLWQYVASSADGTKVVAAQLGGGIWTAHATIAPAPAVSLAIALSNGLPILIWPASLTNRVLQMRSNLASGNWLTVSNGIPFSGVSNGIPFSGLQLTNAPGAGFFRLQ
jgi:photosystem II stability/assembly factor-like uncharacterized protein